MNQYSEIPPVCDASIGKALVGSEVFESTTQRIVELSLAHEWAFQDLGKAWEEGRLVDNLPALILANERHIPEDVREKVLKISRREARTGLFHSHPCDLDRISSARKLKTQPLFNLDISHGKIQTHIEQAKTGDNAKIFASSPPASILFKEFSHRARRVSLDYYRGVFGKEVMSRHLVSVENGGSAADPRSSQKIAHGYTLPIRAQSNSIEPR